MWLYDMLIYILNKTACWKLMQHFENQLVTIGPKSLKILDMKVFRKALHDNIYLKNESLD